MTEKKIYPVPKFKSLEEERKYWDERSPLAEGYEGKVQPGRQKLSSYFALRLTGEEIMRLRNAAAKKDLTISAYARKVLMSAVEKEEGPSKAVTMDDVASLLEQRIPGPVKERLASLVKEMAIGDPVRPTFLVIDASQMKAWEEIGRLLAPLLLSALGATVISPESKEYEHIKDLVRT
ncbi:MAG: hypothetical protein HY671_01000 [Chloroflexi bacterium]|nr:hypothetical protein [Chloroflexota bacterium]